MARTKGTKQLAVEVSEPLFEEFKEFCRDRGETVRHHLELALRRHMDNPPPPPQPAAVPPLPPVPAPAPAEGARPVKAKGKKGAEKDVVPEAVQGKKAVQSKSIFRAHEAAERFRRAQLGPAELQLLVEWAQGISIKGSQKTKRPPCPQHLSENDAAAFNAAAELLLKMPIGDSRRAEAIETFRRTAQDFIDQKAERAARTG